jgi:hypothetical protein
MEFLTLCNFGLWSNYRNVLRIRKSYL